MPTLRIAGLSCRCCSVSSSSSSTRARGIFASRSICGRTSRRRAADSSRSCSNVVRASATSPSSASIGRAARNASRSCRSKSILAACCTSTSSALAPYRASCFAPDRWHRRPRSRMSQLQACRFATPAAFACSWASAAFGTPSRAGALALERLATHRPQREHRAHRPPPVSHMQGAGRRSCHAVRRLRAACRVVATR